MLLEALRHEARRRSLWPPQGGGLDHPLGPAEAFHLVRDMPYGRASSREPLTTIREWRGTCSGKHYLLRALFAELGLRADLMACTTRITAENSPYLPPDLRGLLRDGPIIDIHNYLVLHTPRGPMVVDATWPVHMTTLGLTVNEAFVWGQDMALACEPIVHQVVPRDGDPQAFKESLLRQSADAHELARREAFLGAVSRYSDPDPTREVQILLYRPDPRGLEVLVFHRSPDSGAYWHTVAGAVEAGETDPDAAVREVLEETGFDARGRIRDLIHEYEYRTVCGRSFAVEVPAGWAPQLNDEHDGYQWCGVDEAVRLLRWAETAEALRVLARKIGEG